MRNSRTIASFLLICAVLYLGVFWAALVIHVGPYPAVYSMSDALNLKGGNTWQKFHEFDRNSSYDVIFIGSSHAYRGYDPRIFADHGYRAFNLGTSSQSMMNSHYIIEEYLTARNTGLIVLDVFSAAFELDGLESTADLAQNITSLGAASKMAWALKDPRAVNMLTLRLMTAHTEPYYLDTAYVRSGFSEIHHLAPVDIHYVPERKLKLRKEQLRHFEWIIDLCRKKGIGLVLVDHPAPHPTRGPRYDEMRAYLDRSSKEHNVPFIDMAFSHKLDPLQHFYDHTHLNQRGVVQFNEELIQTLEHINVLK